MVQEQIHDLCDVFWEKSIALMEKLQKFFDKFRERWLDSSTGRWRERQKINRWTETIASTMCRLLLIL